MSVTVHILGRLTRDPIFRNSKNGNDFVFFTVASNSFYGGKERTIFKVVKMWGDQASWVYEHTKKGSFVSVVGTEREDEWDKNGEKQVGSYVLGHYVSFVPTSNKKEDVKEVTETPTPTPTEKPKRNNPKKTTKTEKTEKTEKVETVVEDPVEYDNPEEEVSEDEDIPF